VDDDMRCLEKEVYVERKEGKRRKVDDVKNGGEGEQS
jgi:hypothetical protein